MYKTFFWLCVLSNKLNVSFMKRGLYEASLGMRIWNSSGDGQQHKAFIFPSFALFKKTFQLLLGEAKVTWACLWEDLVKLHLSVLDSNITKKKKLNKNATSFWNKLKYIVFGLYISCCLFLTGLVLVLLFFCLSFIPNDSAIKDVIY